MRSPWIDPGNDCCAGIILYCCGNTGFDQVCKVKEEAGSKPGTVGKNRTELDIWIHGHLAGNDDGEEDMEEEPGDDDDSLVVVMVVVMVGGDGGGRGGEDDDDDDGAANDDDGGCDDDDDDDDDDERCTSVYRESLRNP